MACIDYALLFCMGKEIVRKESPQEPGKRSRLWLPTDIVQVLEENKVNKIDTCGWFSFSSLTFNCLF